jgi:putative transposase
VRSELLKCKLRVFTPREFTKVFQVVLGENDLYRVIKEYTLFFNQARPHQGIEQKIPQGTTAKRTEERTGKIIAFPVLNGLHHDYRCAA